MKKSKKSSPKASGKKVLVVHGPNLNILGKREKKFYGTISVKGINSLLAKTAAASGISIEFFQSNFEGRIVERIQETDAKFIIINPAAFTHTSVAIRDAVIARKIPFVEVHLSNIYGREPFRKISFFSDKALGVISGFKEFSYVFALEYAVRFLRGKKNKISS